MMTRLTMSAITGWLGYAVAAFALAKQPWPGWWWWLAGLSWLVAAHLHLHYREARRRMMSEVQMVAIQRQHSVVDPSGKGPSRVGYIASDGTRTEMQALPLTRAENGTWVWLAYGPAGEVLDPEGTLKVEGCMEGTVVIPQVDVAPDGRLVFMPLPAANHTVN